MMIIPLYIVSLAVFLLPLIFFPTPFVPLAVVKISTAYFAVIALAMFWLYGRIRSGRVRLPTNPIAISAVVLAVAYILSAGFSESPISALFGRGVETGTALFTAFMILALSFASAYLNSHKKILYVYLVFLLSASILIFYHSVKFAFWAGSSSPIGSMADLAIFAGLSAVMSAMAIDFFKFRLPFILLIYALAGFSILILALLNIFTVWVIIAVVSALSVAYHLSFSRSGARSLPIASFSVLIASFVFLFIGKSEGFSAGYIPASASSLGFLAWAGWIAFLGSIAYAGFRFVFSKKDPATDYIFFSLFLSVLYLWLSAVFFNAGIVNLFLAFAFTGALASASRARDGAPSYEYVFLKRRVRHLPAIALVIVISFGLASSFWIGKKLFSAVTFQRGIAVMESDLPLAEKRVMSAILMTPNDMYYRALSDIKLGMLKGVKDPAKFSAIYNDAHGAAQKAVEFDKSNYENWVLLGTVYETLVPMKVKNSYENASEAYVEAIRRNAGGAGNEALLYRLGVIHYAKEDYAKAVSYLEQSVAINPNYSNAEYMLGMSYYSLGNKARAIGAISRVLNTHPDNAEVAEVLKKMKAGASLF